MKKQNKKINDMLTKLDIRMYVRIESIKKVLSKKIKYA